MKTHIATTHHEDYENLKKTIGELATAVEHGIGDGKMRTYTYSVEITESASGTSWEAMHFRS